MADGISRIIERTSREGYPIQSVLNISEEVSRTESRLSGIRCVSAPFSPYLPSMNKHNGTVVLCNPEYLPFKDDSFDAVFSIDGITKLHLPTRIKILKEAARVSRKWVVLGYNNHDISRQEIKKELKEGDFRFRYMAGAAGLFSKDRLVLGVNRHKSLQTFEGNVSRKLWMSYWYQLYEVINLRPGKVLEIGIGHRWVADSLRSRGINVRTLDINRRTCPDLLGSVLSLPFKEGTFDLVLCAEVLEHLPLEQFQKAIAEIRRVSSSHVVMTLPDSAPALKIDLDIPFLRPKRFFFKFPFSLKKNLATEHYWEIGKRGVRLSEIVRVLSEVFKIEKEYVPFENDKHHFFVLKKQERLNERLSGKKTLPE